MPDVDLRNLTAMLIAASDAASISALVAASALTTWTGWVCRTQPHSARTPDVAFWFLLGGALVLYATAKLGHQLGWGQGFGGWLRTLARENAMYAGRRPYQIAASLIVLTLALSLLAYGLYWAPELLKRYRLAIGLASLALGFALIRFVSLHEVDAWVEALPWARPAVDLSAALGASVLAFSRLRSLPTRFR